ncbi:DUF6701 domain-containing protein [Vibrio sp. 99-8-1]|uniref:DUF6701 domain-containing protein n=1 Tax=Vibrio sp. 99-8-1 TaxID=2607602 RepID=UPI001493A238|nr:DUF6701 domain-containing protein [Vibrio sp. 99-8-1]NOI65901.1 hypothetical protein [Vibrio sp. 99-8-1]
MRYLWMTCLLLYSFPGISATTCNVLGHKDFHLVFEMYRSPWNQAIDAYQSGNNNDITMFASDRFSSDLLVDSQLLGSIFPFSRRYEGMITYDASENRLNYYRRNVGDAQWGEVKDSKDYDFKNGNMLLNSRADFIWFLAPDITQCERSLPIIDTPHFPLTDHCPTTAAQTWKNSSAKVTLQQPGKIINAPGRELGFSTIDDNYNRSCNDGRCIAESGRIKESKPPFKEPTLLAGSISGNTILPGHHSSLTIKNNRVMDGGVYYIDELLKIDGGKLTIRGKTTLYVNKMEVVSGGKIEVKSANPDDLVIVSIDGRKGNSELILKSTSTNKVYAHLYSERYTELSESMNLHGSITTKELIIKDDAQLTTKLPKECDVSPPTSYKVDITPLKEFALVCEEPQLTVTIRDQATNEVVTDYNGQVSLTLPGSLSVKSVVPNQTIGGSYVTDQGILKATLTSSDYGQFSISALLDSGENGSSELYVAPYRFDIQTKDVVDSNGVEVIAAKNQAFTISALACNDGSVDVVSNYQGDRELSLSNETLENPRQNQGAKWGELRVMNESGQQMLPKESFRFTNGVASGIVNYTESGSISALMTDPDFSCPEGFDCETNDSSSWQGLSGVAEINSRPWTFSVCDPDNSNMAGTSSSGDGFKAAGEDFSLKVAPIVYQDGGTVSGDVDVTSYCGATVTENFFITGGPSATVYLKGTLASPSSGQIGTGSDLILASGESKLHDQHQSDSEGRYYLFDQLYWNEVGSLNVTADIGGVDYLAQQINSGSRNVGRFYPGKLTINQTDIVSDIWQYKQGHNGFAYMDQPITHQFMVQAESARNDSSGKRILTTNYGRFDDNYIVAIDYFAIAQTGVSNGWQVIDSGSNQRIENGDSYQWAGSDWKNGSTNDSFALMPVVISNFQFNKQQKPDVANTSIVDGPFSSVATQQAIFGLKVTTADAEVDFANLNFGAELPGETSHTASQFSVQPEFRYGRMTLSDVGGSQNGSISIPLKVEYWNGDVFKINDKDSASEFVADYYCREKIWSDGSQASSAAFSLNGDNKVLLGLNSGLSAQQGSNRREQVRLWLRQQNTIPSDLTSSDCFSSANTVDQPWLRYNWREKGDEDPSSVVTFGVFRGNDRVIFRGESGLIGQ